MSRLPGLHRKARIVARIRIAPAVFLWGCVLLVVDAASNDKMQNNGRDLVQHWDNVQTYLNRFGYLSPSPDGADNLRTEDKLREAIRGMQRFGGVPITGVVDGPTLSLLGRRRCGMPDMSAAERVRRYAAQGQKWTKKDITWSLKLLPRSMSEALVRAELRRAFKVWSDVSLLNFHEVSSVGADIVVSFERGKHGDGYGFDGRGMVLAHAFFPGEGIGGDAHFDTEEPWIDRDIVGVDGVRLFAVAAHEFGHSLGLSHSSVSGALMNPFYQTIQDNFQLPRDDAIGIQTLYGPRNPTKFVPFSPNIPLLTPKTPPRAGDTPKYPSSSPTNPPQMRPHLCNTDFDAISVIRGDLFAFKGKYLWWLNSQSLMKEPFHFKRMWNDTELDAIDAVYERSDRKIVFFSGARFWLFSGKTKQTGYPRPLTDLGLPPDLKSVDAAFVWGHNGKTYLFSGTQYWRYEESEGKVELDYPRDMSLWRGVPYNVDAAFQYSDGLTYFFKGKKHWQFNDNRMQVEKKKLQKTTNERWFGFGCPSRAEEPPEEYDDEEDTQKNKRIFVANDSVSFSNCVMFVILFEFILFRTGLLVANL